MCRRDCIADVDCAGALVCNAIGRCEPAADMGEPPPTDLGSLDVGAADLAAPVDARPEDTGAPDAGLALGDLGGPDLDAADMGGPPSPDLGSPDLGGPRLGYLSVCTSDAQCESGVCTPDGPDGVRVCSKTCTGDAQCADWHMCLQAAPGATGYCTWDDTGKTCTGAVDGECAFACLYSAPRAGHCTHPCTTALDCPGGYGCVYAIAGDTGSPRVCAWINRDCPIDASQCPTSLGVCGPDPLSGSTAGTWCSGQCATSADCPRIDGTPQTCAPQRLEDGGTVTVCTPHPTHGDRASGSPCSTNSQCRSGICARPEGASPTGLCLERCTPTSGCAVGFGCNAVVLSGTGMAANVCVPAGRGRSLAPCSANSQCRSGACSTRAAVCIDSCQNGFCPPGTVCTAEGLVVDGISLSSCRAP
jgi:hypothetical protein